MAVSAFTRGVCRVGSSLTLPCISDATTTPRSIKREEVGQDWELALLLWTREGSGVHGSHRVSQFCREVVFVVVWVTCEVFSCNSHRNYLAAFCFRDALSDLLLIKSLLFSRPNKFFWVAFRLHILFSFFMRSVDLIFRNLQWCQ